uniref:uncharacterized protein LOC122610410 n=1 Tax=Erigeron canadensis TaxID=72917 RepID=UPI001CB9D37D|nr:uncharacterized protein LOC122610410 [Erigeron canadensis]
MEGYVDDNVRPIDNVFENGVNVFGTLISNLDFGDPLYLHASDTSGVPLISLKLKGTEIYKIWACAMELALETKNKLCFINGSCEKPVDNEVLAKQWERCNYVVFSWILGSLFDDVYLGQFFSKDAMVVWEELKETYDKVDGSITFNLHHKINSLTQNGNTLAHYYHRLNALWRHPNGTQAKVVKIGNLNLTKHITLYGALVIPEYCDLRTRITMGNGNECGGLYLFDETVYGKNDANCFNTNLMCNVSKHTWHSRLCHPVEQMDQKSVAIYHVNERDTIIENGTLLGDAILQHKDAPPIDSTAHRKLNWLRSQTIGNSAEIYTPFGKRKLTYADHTASGRCLLYIEDYIIRNVLPFYGNTHTSDSYVGDQTSKNFHGATEFIKKCLGGTKDDGLLFCGSGTTAAIKRLQEVMGIAVSPILKQKVLNSCLQNEERWVVFVGPYEHHSNLLSWRQSLAEVIEISLDNQGLINMDDLKSHLEYFQSTGRPMLGSFSACSNVTGLYSDTRAISRLLHQFGAFACFDFAASGPYVEIDMRSGAVDGYDAISLSPHKFLGGPGSPGILLMNKALYQLKDYPPSTCGGGTVNYVNYFDENDTLYINDIEQREDAGTPQIIQRVKAALAFQVKEYIGYKTIAEIEHIYTTNALERLTKNPNIWVLGNTRVDRQAIISFLVLTTATTSDIGNVDNKADGGIHMQSKKNKDKPLDGGFVAKLLNDLFGIQARGGCACAGPYGHHLLGISEPLSLAIRSSVEKGYIGTKSGWTRVSFPYYMSNEEYKFILSAIEFVATYGQRFLPFYEFNWNTGSWKFTNSTFDMTIPEEIVCKLCTLSVLKKIECITDDIFAYYLEVAKHIWSILPKFPSNCTLPEAINPSSVWFWV